MKRTGYCGLGTAVQKLGLESEIAPNVDFVVRNSFQGEKCSLLILNVGRFYW